MRDQWEYKILKEQGFFRSVLRDGYGSEYSGLTEAMLNRLGQEGWEVCGYSHSNLSRLTLIFKRRRDPSG